jgi:hypothetical protein
VRVGIIQSSFIPWRGYFDFIASVDVFVFLESAQFTKNDWRNRNKIKTPSGVVWLSVPVRHISLSQRIDETEIENNQPWVRRHMNAWQLNYAKAPFYQDIKELLSPLKEIEFRMISELNIFLIRSICAYLEIKTRLVHSSELNVEGGRTERLINIVKSLEGVCYLSGPAADAYLDQGLFAKAGVVLEYKSYDYAPYPQLWGGFEGAVTILDLIANCGKEAVHHFRSRTPDIRIA